jgi:hypothetical protein
MAKTAGDLFAYLPEYKVAVCRACRFAVWPGQSKTHLRRHHPEICLETRAQIVRELGGWPGICQQPANLQGPTGVPDPFVDLMLYTDGVQCQLQPRSCQYICRSLKTLQIHWSQTHQWTAGCRGGDRGIERVQAIAQRRNDAYRSVWCQRFFVVGGGTPYFEVARPTQPALDPRKSPGPEDSLLDTMLADLAAREADGDADKRAQNPLYKQEVSP